MKNPFDLLIQVAADVIITQIKVFGIMVAFEIIGYFFSSLITNLISIIQPYHAKALILLERSGKTLSPLVASIVVT